MLQTVRYDSSGLIPKSAKKSTADEEESSVDVYPLMLRVSVMQEVNMTIKISKKVPFFYFFFFTFHVGMKN
jgi:hypothetical protein